MSRSRPRNHTFIHFKRFLLLSVLLLLFSFSTAIIRPIVIMLSRWISGEIRVLSRCEAHLELLLSFGLPDLIFTFTDQTDILPEAPKGLRSS